MKFVIDLIPQFQFNILSTQFNNTFLIHIEFLFNTHKFMNKYFIQKIKILLNVEKEK